MKMLYTLISKLHWFVLNLCPIWEPGNKAARFPRTTKFLFKLENKAYSIVATEKCEYCKHTTNNLEEGDYTECDMCQGTGKVLPGMNEMA